MVAATSEAKVLSQMGPFLAISFLMVYSLLIFLNWIFDNSQNTLFLLNGK